jgi:probable HAF family extracellular repeat protein
MSQLTYNFADIAPPGETEDYATGINDVGQIVGHFRAVGELGYLYSGRSFTTVSFPTQGFAVSGDTKTQVSDHAWITEPGALNDAGEIVGTYTPAHSIYPVFIYNDGTYTALNLTGGIGIFSTGINNAGQIVGSLYDFSTGLASITAVGFLYKDGKYTTLQAPLGAKGTFASDINNEGKIVGHYFDGSNVAHGFLYKDGIYTTIDDPLTTGGTYLTGINDKGQMVGY